MGYLQEDVELHFALVQELLVDGLEGQFAERRQLQLLQRGKTLRTQEERPGSEHRHSHSPSGPLSSCQVSIRAK